MRVLGIHGSPHLDGNTAYALRYALHELEQLGVKTEYLALAELGILPCEGCFHCRDGACIHEDGMTRVYDAMRRADGIILASPVWMGMVTGLMKTMMDRTVLFRTGGRFGLSGKVGAGISCGGFRNGGQELTLQNMQTFFLQQDMYTIADGPQFSHSGAAIVGAAMADRVGLTTVANVARRMATALQARSGASEHRATD